VLLTVADSGAGMDSDTLARIFEPFFTTKEPGRGTGLGLSTVYGIVRQSGGHLEVKSETGRGSVFGVYLPAVLAEPEEAPVVPPPAGTVLGSEVILLVEDELQVRTLVRRILEMHGYRVLEAGLGEEAITRSREFEGQIHLLLTDVVMPRMNGRELYESLRKHRPDMRVLYMSGFTESAFPAEGVKEADFAFIQKPFDPGTLARKLREVLAGR
jgi:CheY-like chemotaxis protein